MPPWAWQASAQYGHRLLQRAAELRLVRPIGTPRHHRFLQSPQRQVSEHVLPIFLRAVDDGVAAVRHRCPERILGVGEEMAPLRLQQVDDVQVFALRLAVRAVRAEEMHMRVAAEPALRVHVRPTLESQRQLALSRLDVYLRPQRLVLEAARHIHDHLAARQPALAAPVNIRVRNLPQAQVPADVHMPRIKIRVDVIVMAVRLIRNALRRAEVDAAGDGTIGLVIEDGDVHPVPTAIHDFQLQARRFDFSLGLERTPVCPTDFLARRFNRNGSRGDGRDLDIRLARRFVLRLAPAFEVVREKIVRGLLRQRKRERRHAAIHVHFQRERFRGVLRLWQRDLHLALCTAREGRFLVEPERDCGDDELPVGRFEPH